MGSDHSAAGEGVLIGIRSGCAATLCLIWVVYWEHAGMHVMDGGSPDPWLTFFREEQATVLKIRHSDSHVNFLFRFLYLILLSCWDTCAYSSTILDNGIHCVHPLTGPRKGQQKADEKRVYQLFCGFSLGCRLRDR